MERRVEPRGVGRALRSWVVKNPARRTSVCPMSLRNTTRLSFKRATGGRSISDVNVIRSRYAPFSLEGSIWSMWRPTISLVALCSTHVGVTFEGGEYLCRGAAVHDPIESSAAVRQPDVEPSNKLQLVAFSDLLLGALRFRGTKDCNDLSWLYRLRTDVPL